MAEAEILAHQQLMCDEDRRLRLTRAKPLPDGLDEPLRPVHQRSTLAAGLGSHRDQPQTRAGEQLQSTATIISAVHPERESAARAGMS
jgi:hypothetical protein